MKKSKTPHVGNTTNDVSFLGLPCNMGEFRESVSRLSNCPGNPDASWMAGGESLRAQLIAWCEITEAKAAATLRTSDSETSRCDAERSSILAAANRKLISLIEGIVERVLSHNESLLNEKRERDAAKEIENHDYLKLRARDIRNPDGSYPAQDQLDKATKITRVIEGLVSVNLDSRDALFEQKIMGLIQEGVIDEMLTLEGARKRVEELESEYHAVQKTIDNGLTADEILLLLSLTEEIEGLERQKAAALRRANALKSEVMEKEEEIRRYAEVALIITDAVITGHEINANSISSAA